MAYREWAICRMRFDEPLHISRGKGENYNTSETFVRSDTLKSALFSVALMLGRERTQQEKEHLFNNFRLSSAWPYAGEEFFFPRPMMQLPLMLKGEDTALDPLLAKDVKKLAFLTKTHFESLINGRNIELDREELVKGGSFLSADTDRTGKAFITSELQQRLYVPENAGEDPKPYYVDRVYFEQAGHPRGCGLYFITEFLEGEVEELIRRAAVLLGEQGIGTDRSVGNGHFTAEWDTLKLEIPDEGNAQMNLSLFCPTREELLEILRARASYNLIRRAGYIASAEDPDQRHYRRKSIQMFTEGSVFESGAKLQGKVVDVRPDQAPVAHPVWRDGTAIFIPVILPAL